MCFYLFVAGKRMDNSSKATLKYHDNSTSSTKVYNHTKETATSLMVNSDVMITMDNTVVPNDLTSANVSTAFGDTDDTFTAHLKTAVKDTYDTDLSTAVKDTDDTTAADVTTAVKDTISFAAMNNSSTQIF